MHYPLLARARTLQLSLGPSSKKYATKLDVFFAYTTRKTLTLYEIDTNILPIHRMKRGEDERRGCGGHTVEGERRVEVGVAVAVSGR